MEEFDVLMVPGIGKPDQSHWQSIWKGTRANYYMVHQDNWDEPDRDLWVESLATHIESFDKPLFIVAHSLGCALVAHWAARNRQSGSEQTAALISGAMLVCPADVDSSEHAPDEVRNFSPMPLVPFPFTSIVAASEDDPYVSQQRAKFFTQNWGSDFVGVGLRGHINTNSGHGPWPEGWAKLQEFIDRRDKISLIRTVQ